MTDLPPWPPQNCPSESLCRQGIVPSAYHGCSCWFFSHGGELAEDGIHCGKPPMTSGVIDWGQRWSGYDEPSLAAIRDAEALAAALARLPETGRKG